MVKIKRCFVQSISPSPSLASSSSPSFEKETEHRAGKVHGCRRLPGHLPNRRHCASQHGKNDLLAVATEMLNEFLVDPSKFTAAVPAPGAPDAAAAPAAKEESEEEEDDNMWFGLCD